MTEPTTSTTTTPATIAATTTTPTPPSDGMEKTLTQADVDRVVAERVNREKARFADYGDLKAKASRLDEIEAANKSELERAVEKARNEGRSEVQSVANGRLVAAEARALAAEARFRSPATAVKLLDLSQVTVGDDGAVDTAAVKTLLDELSAAESYLLADDTTGTVPAAHVGIGTVSTTTPMDPVAADHAQIEADIRASKARRRN